MSRKHNSTKSNPTKNEKAPDKTAIYVALISLAGVIIVAIINSVSSYINTRTQILLPISLTQTLLPTKTSVPTYQTTPIACGGGTVPAINTPMPVNSKPTFVVITVDEGVTWLTLENVLVSLDNSLKIGDRVIVLVDGKQNFSDAVIADETITSVFSYPVPPASPTPQPTATPSQVQNPNTTLQKIVASQTAQAAIIQATQVSAEYLCSVYQWNSSYQITYSQWQAENQKSVARFVESLRQKIQSYSFNNPSPTEFEGLIFASNIFAVECNDKSYGKCVFVPMTVMQEWRSQPSEIKVDFRNVEVVGTMTDCSLYDSACRERVVYWQSFFTMNNAKSVSFVNLNDFWASLADIISQ